MGGGLNRRPDLWSRVSAASGSLRKFASTFANPSESLLPELRPPRAYAVITPPEQKTLEALADAIARVERSGPNVELDHRAVAALNQIASLIERPALFIQDGTFTTPDSRWRILEHSKRQLERAIAAVGRVEFERPSGESQLGTGFLVAPNLIITNRHVARLLASERKGSWKVKPGVRPRIDFLEENQSVTERQFEIEAVEFVSDDPRLDVALMSIARQGVGGEAQPDPVTLSQRTHPRKDRLVATIGYPREGEGKDAGLQRAMLAGRFGVKRLQPGRVLRSASPIFAHDCTTTTGNSGSCVVAIQDGAAIGLHYFGTTRVENLAVALEPLVRRKIWTS